MDLQVGISHCGTDGICVRPQLTNRGVAGSAEANVQCRQTEDLLALGFRRDEYNAGPGLRVQLLDLAAEFDVGSFVGGDDGG